MVVYKDAVTSCNRCGGVNELLDRYCINAVLIGAQTRCRKCGFEDYWAYGYFDSGLAGFSSCRKHCFDNGLYTEVDNNEQ